MALVPYVAYVNRTNGPRSPYYDTNLPGLDGARDLNHLRTKVPETFRELYRRYNHNVRSWEIKSGVLPANRAAIVSVPVNIPLGDLFLPAGLWIFSSAEAIAFAQRVWVVWGQGGRGVWSVAGAGQMPGYHRVADAAPGPQPPPGPPPNLYVSGDSSDEDSEDSGEN